jgi:hypothetical protein
VSVKVVQYSNSVDKPYKLLVRSNCSNEKPTFTALHQLHLPNSPGLLLSPAKVSSSFSSSQDCYDVTVEFSEEDSGKMMFLFVAFDEFVQQQVPLTYQPVKGTLEENKQFTA